MTDKCEKLRVDEFDYDLPRRFIAQHPAARRGESRLMVVGRIDGGFSHRKFSELPDLLLPGDLLVFNDTRVIPARFFARRATGGRVEGCFLRELPDGSWEVLLRGRLRAGMELAIVNDDEEVRAAIVLEESEGQGVWHVRPAEAVDAFRLLNDVGKVPLPPYIGRKVADPEQAAEDRERYQTVYARSDGAVAAPTAGLHFTHGLMEQLKSRGMEAAFVTLHVGLGTFQPVRETRVAAHRMHSEYYELSTAAAEAIRNARAEGRRIVAVGTTTVRALESSAAKGEICAEAEWTGIFIYPPHRFRVVDAMITNFHLPKSTLLMLVAAFAGRERI
ncbi:MAG: tRNA preQ1(34) S-adenosylmethionine ribosyltransferase-isomerase QueA, partial [Phycisphaerae bacterium]|nr:tRNA preQ1(34) S-adenosylmethionine ribosyltransferase-isomerase QueA [Phycisphaerae bacterium]